MTRTRLRPIWYVHWAAVPYTFLLSPAVTTVRWIAQSSRRVKVQVHRAYQMPTAASVSPNFGWVKARPSGEFSEQFYIKVTNLSPKRPITITHVWVESLDRTTDDVQIMNPEETAAPRDWDSTTSTRHGFL